MNPDSEKAAVKGSAELSPEPAVSRGGLGETKAGGAPCRRISKTLIAAYIILGLGIWQMIQISSGGGSLFQFAKEMTSVPVELRPDRLMPPARDLPSTDPVGAYVSNSKRGMTDKEIRWMIEDFQQVRMMPTSGNIEEYRSFRERQNKWYLTAVTEALSLTPEQRQSVQKSLRGLLDQAEEGFKREVDEASARGEVPNGNIVNPYLEATFWLRNAEFAPWNLCELTEAQADLTMERSWLEQKESAMKMPDPFNQEPMWLNYMAIAMKDPVSGNLITYPPPSPPRHGLHHARYRQGRNHGHLSSLSSDTGPEA